MCFVLLEWLFTVFIVFTKRTMNARTAAVLLALPVASAAWPALLAAQNCGRAAGAEVARGWVAYRSGEINTAARAFANARALCRTDLEAMSGLSYVALRRGQLRQARAWSDSVLKYNPRHVDALVARGLAAWRSNDAPGARRAFGRVLELDSTRTEAREYLARLPAGA